MTDRYDTKKKSLMKIRQDSKCIRCPRWCVLHIKIMGLWYQKPWLDLRFWYLNDPPSPFLHYSLTIPKPLLLYFCQPLVCSCPITCIFPLWSQPFRLQCPHSQPLWDGSFSHGCPGTLPRRLWQPRSSLCLPLLIWGPGILSGPDLVLIWSH